MRRRGAAREARDRKVEAAPEELDRARLPLEAGAKGLEHRHNDGERIAQRRGRLRIVRARGVIVREADRIGDLVGPAVEMRRQLVPVEHSHEGGVQIGNALPVGKRQPVARPVADPHDDRVGAKVDPQREGSTVRACGRFGDQPERGRMQGHMPAVIGPGGIGDADLAQHLACEMERREGPAIPLDIEGWPIPRHGAPPCARPPKPA